MGKGLILKCSNSSEADCYNLSVLWSDVLVRDAVLMIEPGDRLFLLNIESNTLSGSFEAISNGGYRLVPQAWKGKYPYQVKVRQTNGRHTINYAKESLSLLKIRSHSLLQDFEAEAVHSLLGAESSGHQPSLPLVTPPPAETIN